jgi:dipeptidase
MKPRSILAAFFVLLLSAFVFTGGQQPQEPTRAMGSSLAKVCLRPELLPPGTDVADLCDHCTSIPVGKDASIDGGTMTTHSCDGHYEFQIHVVSGQKFAKGTMRPIMKGGGYGQDRPQAKKVGEIPEVDETLTRYDAAYSFMNEKQVGIGETTISGRRELFNDEGLFDIMELERVALERATTAREAITIMGELAEKYGYGDGGECLTVIDPKEAWQFEIFGAGPMEKGAVWGAKRIPDGEVGVSANHSRITTLDLKDPANAMGSATMQKVAEELGFWKPGEPFVFRRVFDTAPSLGSTRREWRVLSTLAPSAHLDPWELELPFSVKPDRKVTPQDLMKLHRDSYEGTEFDMTKGPAAGPFGNPNRFGTGMRPAEGYMGWERTISIFRCSYATVIQSRGWLPAWIGGLVRRGRPEDVGLRAAVRRRDQAARVTADRIAHRGRSQVGVVGVRLRQQLGQPAVERDVQGHPRPRRRDREGVLRPAGGGREEGGRPLQAGSGEGAGIPHRLHQHDGAEDGGGVVEVLRRDDRQVQRRLHHRERARAVGRLPARLARAGRLRQDEDPQARREAAGEVSADLARRARGDRDSESRSLTALPRVGAWRVLSPGSPSVLARKALVTGVALGPLGDPRPAPPARWDISSWPRFRRQPERVT